MKWRDHPIVAFDTETTGLMPFGGDRIIEFAAVLFRLGPDGRVTDREDHSFLVNPGMPIPRKATEISGISDADVAAAPAFADVADRIRELIENSVSVAHNYPFDLGFLTQEFQRLGAGWPEPLAEIDTVDLSLRCFPDAKSHRLSDLCARLDIPFEGAHRATNDAAACGQCFVTLARQHDVEDDLQAMLDWANAIGRPPEDGPIGPDPTGKAVFLDGPHQGDPVSAHPVHLQWMTKARTRSRQGWTWRYSDSTRAWARRWLEVRGAGRARQSPRSYHPEDWALDSCIAAPRRAGR